MAGRLCQHLPAGWHSQAAHSAPAQATQLREYVDQHSFRRLVDVIIVSPLSRALETAVGAFGGADADAGSDGLLMRAITAEEVRSGFVSFCTPVSPCWLGMVDFAAAAHGAEPPR